MRFLVVLLVFAAVYLFVYWIPFAFIPVGDAEWIPNLGALACALGAGWFVWSMTGTAGSGLVRSILYGAFVVGAIGLVGGFFGPLILTPEANQGPLLGLFITGPLGALVGGIGGFVYWLTVRRGERRS